MPFQFIFHNNIEGFCDDILTIGMSAFSFDSAKCESVSEVEILKQTIEILKKDLVKCKAEIKRLNEIINERDEEEDFEIWQYFNRCGSVRKTAQKYDISIEELFELIEELDGDNKDLRGALDYEECHKEIIGRKQWDEEHECEKRCLEDLDDDEIDDIVKEYKSGEMHLYEIADCHDLSICDFFKLLKTCKLIVKETDAKYYKAFYKQHFGTGFEWDGVTEIGLLEFFS